MAFTSWTDGVIQFVGTIDQTLINAGLVMSSAVSPALKSTLFLFALGVVVIAAIKYLFSEESVMDGVQKMFIFLLIIGGINMALTPDIYSTWMKGVYGGFTELATIVENGGSGGPAKNPGILTVVASFNNVSAQLLHISADIGTLRSQLDWSEVPTSLYYLFLQIEMGIFDAMILGVALLQIAVYLYISLWVAFYIGIAVAFGPIAIITYAFPPLSYMADGWLRFAIGAGIIKVVAVIAMALYGDIMVSVIGSVIPDFVSQHLQTPQQSLSMAENIGFFSFLGMFAYAIPAMIILWSAPEIADKLMSGSRVGGGSVSNPLKLLKIK